PSVSSGRKRRNSNRTPCTYGGRKDITRSAQFGHAWKNPVRPDRAAAEHVFPELPGSDQPALEAGALRAFHIGPKIVAHHGHRPVRREPQARHRRVEEGGARLPRHLGGGAGGVLEGRDERPGVQGQPLALAEVAVAGEGDERRPAHELLERLLEQGEGPALAEVAEDYGVGRGRGAARG